MSFELFCATEYTEYHGIFLKSPILILVIQNGTKCSEESEYISLSPLSRGEMF